MEYTPNHRDKMNDLAKHEAVIRENRGNDLAVAREFKAIAAKGLHKLKPHKIEPTRKYRNIQEYAKVEWGESRRNFFKNVEWANVIDVLSERCPVGHRDQLPVLCPKRTARELHPIIGEPDLMYAKWLEARNTPGAVDPRTGHVMSAAVLKIVGPAKERILVAKVKAVTDRPDDERFKDRFVCADMLDGMGFVADGSMDLVICSPPYGIAGHTDGGGVQYDTYDDNVSHKEYIGRLTAWMNAAVKKLRKGGRLVVNICNTWSREKKSKEYIHPLPARLMGIVEQIPGMMLYQWIVWDRGHLSSATGSDWGTFASCENPNMRRRVEYVLVFSKETFKKQNYDPAKRLVTEEEFGQLSEDIWFENSDTYTRRKYHHPCIFPVKLIERVIKIYGQRSDKILDPFGGIGTTAIAANRLGCEFYSVDLSENYTKMAHVRFLEDLDKREAAEAKAQRKAAKMHKSDAETKPKAIKRKRLD